MKIKILGTRGEVEPFASYHSKHSGVLVDDVLMFDLGEKEFLKYQPKWVFITHLHPDHAFFINTISTENMVDIDLRETLIYTPEVYHGGFQTQIITEKIVFDSYEIQPIPAHHSKFVKSVAYLLKKGEQRLLYTGDLIWVNKEYHHLLANLDLVITEASFLRQGGMVRKDRETGELYGHTGVPNLINLFKKFTQNILFTHFGSWFYEDITVAKKKLWQLGKEQGVNIFVGYDGMEIDSKTLARV